MATTETSLQKTFRPFTLRLNFGVVVVLLLLLSLHLHSLWQLTILGHIDISLVDIVTILLAGVWFARYSFSKRARITRDFLVAFVLVLLFTIWLGFEAMRSPQPVRGLTMWLIMIRNLIILWIVGASLAKYQNISFLNKVIFLLGVGLAAVSLILYMGILQDYSAILADPSRRSGAFYELGERGILRLEGFAGDPNFFALFLSLSLLCGLTIKIRQWPTARWIGLLIIGSALLLSFSRGFLLSLILSIIGIGAIGILWRRLLWQRYIAMIFLPVILLSIIALAATLPYVKAAPAEWFLARFEIIYKRPAWGYWEELFPMVFEHPIIGHGLRIGEEILGGQYTHNSYLDLLLATGIIGFGICLIFTTFVVKIGMVISLKTIDYLPWFQIWLITLLMFFSFSLLYNPFPWIVAGVILSQSGQRGGSKRAWLTC